MRLKLYYYIYTYKNKTLLKLCTGVSKMTGTFEKSIKIRDANFYGLPAVTTENCKKIQFSTDYVKLEFSYGIFLKSRCCQKSAK